MRGIVVGRKSIQRVYCFIFIVAPCISKIHWISHTNKCTNCISYISLKLFTCSVLV